MRYFWTSVLVSVISLATAFIVSGAGVRGRGPYKGGQAEFKAETVSAAYKILKREAGKGRIILCLSLHSHSTVLDDGRFMPYSPYSVAPLEITSSFSGSVNGGNFLWVLMQEGVIRKIIYAVPDREWKRIAKKVTGNESILPPLDISYRGSPIFIYTMQTLPEIREPVLLYIDGSVPSSAGSSEVERFIRGGKIAYDMALVSPGFDNITGGQR